MNELIRFIGAVLICVVGTETPLHVHACGIFKFG